MLRRPLPRPFATAASRSSRRIIAGAALLCVLAFAGGARAADPTPQEKETARALMDKGDELYEKKDLQGALKAYSGAHSIMHVPTTGVEVAKVQEKLGMLVEARDTLMEVVRFPKQPNEPAVFTQARVECEKKAAALAARIPSVEVKVGGAPPDAEVHVTMDKVELSAAASRLPIKVNPGKHHVSVASDLTDSADTDFEIAEGQSISITLSVKRIPGAKKKETPAPGAPAEHGTAWRTIGIITVGTGVAAMLVGGLFGLQAKNKRDDANCPGNLCKNESSANILRDANSAATASTVAFTVGGVLTAGGLAMIFFSPSSSTPAAPAPVKAGVSPVISVGSVGLSGRW
jgi:hypothetical protein